MKDVRPAHGLTEAAFATNYARVRSQARRLVRDRSDADDAVQDAMERAWRFRDRFTSDAAVAPWLAAITRRAALDLLRERRIVTVPLDDTSVADETTERTVVRRETLAAIDVAIGELAPAYREALVLHDVLGYSSREIASRESLPYHTVRTHLFRARRALRGALPRGLAA